jgi:membrane-bound inhibitor of C-type lysozyme
MTYDQRLFVLSASFSALFLQACSPAAPPTAKQGNASGGLQNVVVAPAENGTGFGVDAQAATNQVAPSAANGGFAPGESLAFEWSANGFEQLPAQYKWTGSGKRDADFQPNFSLSVPQTDDGIWSSSCTSGGRIETMLYLTPPSNMTGNRATFKFETDVSTRTLNYSAEYVTGGMSDGFKIVQSPQDPMFQEMKSGSWAYLQIGEGEKPVKLRVSLANASRSLNAFLPACSPRPRQTAAPRPAPTPPPSPRSQAIRYNCEDGRTAMATYLGNDTDNPIVRLEIGGKVMLMSQGVSGSGARYESTPGSTGEKKFVWHNKGSGSLFIESDANDTDGASETIVSCKEP